MRCGQALLAALCTALVAVAPSVSAQNPFTNPSFEQGLLGWQTYGFSCPPAGNPGSPWTARIGVGGFDLIPPSPPSAPSGIYVCGMQSSQSTVNGGVYQQIEWAGGPATITVTARAYSRKSEEAGGQPYDNGCRVRIGLVATWTDDPSQVAGWAIFPWSDAWNTRTITLPGPGTYTLFIEGIQPEATAVMSNLWDDVRFTPRPPIQVTSGPTAAMAPDSDRIAVITWTTDVPSTTRVDYGTGTAYGSFYENTQLVTNHQVQLSGLSNSSLYHYRARSTAPQYADWLSDDLTFETPIQFREIATRLTPDGQNTVVSWKTDVPTTSQVEYGFTQSYGSVSPEDTSLLTNHEVMLTGLQEDSVYHFRVWGRNSLTAYRDAHSADHTFYTLPAARSSLRNSAFEEGHATQSHSLYPWVLYSTYIPSSGYHPIDGLVGPYPKSGGGFWPDHGPEPPYPPNIQAFDGGYFVGAASRSYFKNGGVFQRVLAPDDICCTLSARFITYRLGGKQQDSRIRLGIDPNGGVDPESPAIQWWSTFSETNDNQWHGAGITTRSGSNGIVTVFLEIVQIWPIQWNIVAVDHVDFAQTPTMKIGALKQSTGLLGAVLADKTVTHVFPDSVSLDGKPYRRAYIEEDDRSAGIAVLFDPSKGSIPAVGNKVTVTGSLVTRNHEATVVAYEWSVNTATHPLPAPVGLSQAALGGVAANQKALYSRTGACNVGLRVRIFGRVGASSSYGEPGVDALAYVDDGSGIYDSNTGGLRGLRVIFAADFSRGIDTGRYVAATGVLTIQLVDPDGYPGNGDEFPAYTLCTGGPEDWDVYSP